MKNGPEGPFFIMFMLLFQEHLIHQAAALTFRRQACSKGSV